MRIAILWPTLMSVALLAGCAEKKVYVDRIVEVKVPVRCVVPDVQPSKEGDNDAATLADIVRERDELREANKACK